jgi:hypothetical protein
MKMSKPRFEVERTGLDDLEDDGYEEDEELDEVIDEIVVKVLDKAIGFLEDCKRDGLTLGEAIRLFKKQRRMFLEGL